MKRTVSWSALLAASLILAGCGGGEEPAAPARGTTADVAADNHSEQKPATDDSAATPTADETPQTSKETPQAAETPRMDNENQEEKPLTLDDLPNEGEAFTSRRAAGWGAAHPPEKVVGIARCEECHTKETEQWKTTTHATSFETMPNSPKALEIAEKMGVTRITESQLCVQCHFTRVMEGGEPVAVSGTSCESCHGAARDWIEVHHDFGPGKSSRFEEDPEHFEMRMEKLDAAGMIGPDLVFDVARNCYECHTIPNEELINKGGHPTGTPFELVQRFQGEIRHNFMENPEVNAAAPGVFHPRAHMRVMYMTGRLLDLEMTLRALAQATEEGRYLESLKERFHFAVNHLKELQEKVPTYGVQAALEVVEGLELKPNNAAAYLKAADTIKPNARAFIVATTGFEQPLEAMDSMIPTEYKGKPLPKLPKITEKDLEAAFGRFED